MLYETAARASDILALDVADLDLDARRAAIVSKGGATEYVYWASGTAHLLPRLLRGRAAGPSSSPSADPDRPVVRRSRICAPRPVGPALATTGPGYCSTATPAPGRECRAGTSTRGARAVRLSSEKPLKSTKMHRAS